jgi:ABC-type lipoprotein release transport system permease subunit
MMYREVSAMRFRNEQPMNPFIAAGITAAFMFGVLALCLVAAVVQVWWR